MPETAAVGRVCPFLRGRNGVKDVLEPGEDNYCLLASSIHLPRSQQTRFCLGGRYEQCTRYQLQGNRPIPRYVRGARPMNVRASAPVLQLKTLPWRYPWVRPLLKWTVIILLVVSFVMLWRWRMANTPPYIVERDTLPAAATTPPTPEIPSNYLRPTEGPAQW